MTMTRDEVLAKFAATVRSAIRPPSCEVFDAERWPYTYAADFLLSHPEIIPEAIRTELVVMEARSDASKARRMWTVDLGIDDKSAVVVLAAAYMVEHDVQDVPVSILAPSAQVIVGLGSDAW